MPRKALIVDDEPSILGILKTTFESRNFEVATAASAQEAVRKLAESHFDLVVTDMRMETSTSGYDVVRTAKSLPQRPVVVILTAFPIPPTEWRQSGADALYVKGGGFLRIIENIESLLRTRETDRQAPQTGDTSVA